MALGVPVVSTAAMGTIDILQPQQGALIAEEDEKDFASQVYKVIMDRDFRKHLAHEAIHYATSWSAPALTRKMLSLYQETTGHESDIFNPIIAGKNFITGSSTTRM
jgi:glycosyltransferase involved in cell wall biosynthesis